MSNPVSPTLFQVARELLSEGKAVIALEIVNAKGSTPRDKGCRMLVTESKIFGTIGGGRLEFVATQDARSMIAENRDRLTRTIPLGPEIGQCCGGSVTVSYGRLSSSADPFFQEAGAGDDPHPVIQVHGAGHTGKALAKVLALLPFDVSLIDTRRDILMEVDIGVKKVHTPLPEENVRRAAPGTAFVIFTHEHNLDFLIAAEALKRGDAAYVGMIGSKTKRAVFESWLEDHGYDRKMAQSLVSPIGGSAVHDKRPEIIAALVGAELIEVLDRLSRT